MEQQPPFAVAEAIHLRNRGYHPSVAWTHNKQGQVTGVTYRFRLDSSKDAMRRWVKREMKRLGVSYRIVDAGRTDRDKWVKLRFKEAYWLNRNQDKAKERP